MKRILAEQNLQIDFAISAPEELDDYGQTQIIVVDVSEIKDGIAVCTAIRERAPAVRTVIMADECSMDNVSCAFASGAVDSYLVKEISCKPLAGALRLTALGERVLPSKIAEALAMAPAIRVAPTWQNGSSGCNLSAREIEILRCLIEGEPNKVISRRLAIADATVKVHIKAILRKLRVRNRTQAAIWAVNRGLCEAPRPAAAVIPMPTPYVPPVIAAQIVADMRVAKLG